ncbi:BRCA1-A complex subunit Abraxas 1 isoform X3 [Phyllopteryx taeniolatus]|uniref:BRCA1-A complex subunit Abraxas 1 isoform X3 n=1 Tax=Phyllopteryx taeniolatus TaxID=161469 RepID=UPI002AD44847|nr:BRCA1-A complex subunit Abraxas 1 isoform X3 [Phyllopteryx taeniolatus]
MNPKQGKTMAEPTVRVSGIVLTSLMFQHISKDSDVEGLILGENHVEEHVTISDAQEDHVHLRQTYSILKHVCCHKLNTWYDAAGRVDVAAVHRLLGANHLERVIGWYRQRRNTERQMSMREKAVHQNLKVALRKPHAVFLLVTPTTLTDAGSTHRTEYAAFLSSSRCKVPVAVTNMASLDHRAYWMASTPCSAPGYQRAVSRHSSKMLDASGQSADVDAVNAMNASLQDELQRACSAVVDSERAVEKTLSDVFALRKTIGERKSALASKEGAPVAERNVRLQLAIRALFARHSDLFACPHTLTLDGFPVPAGEMASRPLQPTATVKRYAAGVPQDGRKKRRKGDATK